MNLATISAKLSAGTPLTAEERAFLNQQLDAQAGQPAAVTPPAADTTSWPAEARAAFEAMSARLDATERRAETAERSASAERDIRLDAHFRGRALALGQPESFASVLRAASERLSAEDYAAYEAALERGAQASASLLQEQGSATAGPGGDVMAELDSRARALMAKDTALTYEGAQRQVMADTDFARRYHGALRR